MVYVEATADRVAEVREQLEKQGYSVCEAEASVVEAEAAQAGEAGLPGALERCIATSDVCVFLLPKELASDGALGQGAGFADQAGKLIIGIVSGDRAVYPEQFQDAASSMIRDKSAALPEALKNGEIWEKATGERVIERPFKTVKCQ